MDAKNVGKSFALTPAARSRRSSLTRTTYGENAIMTRRKYCI